MPALGESVTEGTVTRWLKASATGRGRRAAARGLHRQGRHRDPVAGRRHAAGDHASARTRPSRSAPQLAVIGDAGQASPAGSSADAPAAGRAGAGRARGAGRRAGGSAAGGPRSRPGAPSRTPPGRTLRAADGRRAGSAPTAGAGAQRRRRRSGRRRGACPYVTPLVRKLAAENGVDLATVTGTGVGGRIRKQDVLAAAEKAAARAGAGAGAGGAGPPGGRRLAGPGAPAAAHAGQGRPRAGHARRSCRGCGRSSPSG